MHLSEISDLLPEGEVAAGPAAGAFAVNGLLPAAVAAPGSREEAAALIRRAADRGWALVPYGGGTWIDFGLAPRAREDSLVVLSTRRLDRLVDYQPDDMTVTVEPGVTMAALERVLGERGQFLPLNPALPSRSTVGGMMAAAVTGPWCAGYGHPRDWIIGCRVVGPDGLEVRGGGQVVKNVAGYDLPKLYTGSFGTLGLITEVTFKVMPQPPAAGCARVALRSPEEVEAVTARVMDSDLQPAALELAHAAFWSEAGRPLPDGSAWGLFLQFLHFPEAVEWQLTELSRLAGGASGTVERLDEASGSELMDRLRDEPARYPLVARIGTTSSRTAELAAEAAAACERLGAPPRVLGHAANGRLYVCGGAEGAAELPEVLRARARTAGASCMFPRLPAALAGTVDPWGEPGPGSRLMQGLKQTLDPEGLFSPGRFAGGL